MRLGTLSASLLGNMLQRKGIIRAGEGTVRVGYGPKSSSTKRSSLKNFFLIPPLLLTNFEIQRYYQNEPRFNGVYSRDNLPNKIKDGVYVINLDDYSDIGIHWIALYVNINTKTNFDNFGVEHIPKKIKKFCNNKT